MYKLYQTKNENDASKTMKRKQQKMYTNTSKYWWRLFIATSFIAICFIVVDEKGNHVNIATSFKAICFIVMIGRVTM